jgi:hypothetical protein
MLNECSFEVISRIEQSLSGPPDGFAPDTAMAPATSVLLGKAAN